MRTKTFLTNAALFAAATGSLLAAPASNHWIEQHARAKQGVYTAEHSDSRSGRPVAAESWMEQNHKAKTGTYSAAEEARLRELQNSSAYRQEITNGRVQNWQEHHRQVKQGR